VKKAKGLLNSWEIKSIYLKYTKSFKNQNVDVKMSQWKS
jgi:hypothetical protein